MLFSWVIVNKRRTEYFLEETKYAYLIEKLSSAFYYDIFWATRHRLEWIT